MADEKKADAPDVLELVAVERGFAAGRLVEPGAKFKFRAKDSDGKVRKLPKWAKLASDTTPAKAKPHNGDLKPKDAQDAVKAKAGALANNGQAADPV